MRLSRKISTRLVKCILYIILVLTFLWKAYEAWHKYNKGDKMIITEVKYPETQTFPSVTLCRKIILDFYKGNNVMDIIKYNSKLDNWLSFNFNGINTIRIWEYRQMAKYIARGNNFTDCFTFNPPRQIKAGIQHTLKLMIKSNMSDMLYMILHEPLNNIPTFGDIFGTNALALPIITQDTMFIDMHLAVTTEISHRLNTDEQPCHEINTNQTFCDCIDNHFQESEGCILSWHQSKMNKKVCNETQLLNYQKYMEGFINEASYGKVFRMTGCIPNCKQSLYTLKKSMEVSYPRENENYSIHIGIFLAPTGVTLRREVLVFDALELIGNVGGYLGLLLGWSALSVVQWYLKHNCQKC